jgi:hypothetical protein
MMTMWIIVGVAAVAMVTWRLRKASARLNRILRDDGPARRSETQTLPASHDR